MTHRAVMALADSERTGPAGGSRSLNLGLLTIPRRTRRYAYAQRTKRKGLRLQDDSLHAARQDVLPDVPVRLDIGPIVPVDRIREPFS